MKHKSKPEKVTGVPVPRKRVMRHQHFRSGKRPITGLAVYDDLGNIRWLTFWEYLVFKITGLGPRK